MKSLKSLTNQLFRSSDARQCEASAIRRSGLFDEIWFREQQREATTAQTDTIEWYLQTCPAAPPHPLFDPGHYTEHVPSWQQHAISPLGHYVLLGAAAGAKPHPLFDPKWYSKQVVGVPQHELFAHYLREGFASGLSPHPAFDPKYYLQQAPDLRSGRVNPLTHFVQLGWRQGLSPNRCFDASWYATRYSRVVAEGTNPLMHFLATGAAEGLMPHPGIDLARYAAERPDAPADRAAGYLHLLQCGLDWISDDSLAAARQSAASAVSASFDAGDGQNVIASILDLDSFRPLIADRDRPPVALPTGAPSALLAAIDEAKHVNFDIWDTLLRRDCHPNEIKLQSARLLKLKGQPFLRDQGSTQVDLLRLRLEAEMAVARADFEFRFPDALDVWLWNALVPNVPPEALTRLREALLDHEFHAEARATRPDGMAREALATTAGRSSYASDFYMPDGFIDRLLAVHGLHEGFIGRHVSCDTFETKREGGLFERVLTTAGVAASELLHVGDNLKADVDRPRARGIRTVRYRVPVEEQRRSWFAEAFNALREGDATLHHRRILGLLEDVAQAARDPHLSTGVRLGLLPFGLCLAAAENATAAVADRLWFFTREGAFLQRVYEAIRSADPYGTELPRSELLEVSRLATFGPSLPDLTPESLMRLWTLYSRQSPSAFGASIGLDRDLTRRVALRHGLLPDNALDYPWKHAKFLAMLTDNEFLAAAGQRLDKQRKLLQRYLRERGFDRAAAPQYCVDIGWRGTIQDNLALVSGAATIGWYLGLFGFLNSQPPRSQKHGWLGDDNQTDKPFELGEVAGFEMLFNAPGGSVQEYREVAGQVVAHRARVAGEEAVIEGPIALLQKGMLEAVAPLAEYVRLHGLMASDLQPLARIMARSLAERPPVEVADAFAALDHNETFGTGGIERVGRRGQLRSEISNLARGNLLASARSALGGARWPAASVRATETRDWLRTLSPAARAALPVAVNLAEGPAIIRPGGDKLAIYAPPPLRASGGHRTIYNIAARLQRLGWKLEIFLEGVGEGAEAAEEYLESTPAVIHTNWHSHIPSDTALATIAHSARFVAELTEPHHRAYLVQDFEALFDPMSDAYLWKEASYTYGLRHITIGNWLTHVLQRQYAADAVPTGLGVDTKRYRQQPEVPREFAVCFLYQPEKLRRASQHGLHTLRLLKRAIPEIKIFVYGNSTPATLDFPVVDLGLVHDLDQLARLYARCRVGLCVSASNPSRIPFEMMAAGCVPVDLYRYNNLLDYRTGTARLANPGEYSLAAAIIALLKDDTDWRRRSFACAQDAGERTLEWEMEAAANHMVDLLRGTSAQQPWRFQEWYGEQPVIAPEEDRPGVRAFLKAQFAQIADVVETTAVPRVALRHVA